MFPSDLNGPASDLWSVLSSPLPTSVDLSTLPLLTSPSNASSEYPDLSLFCEPSLLLTDDSSSIFSTLPPTPISAPLSPEEQEIQYIVTSFQDPSPFYTPTSPSVTQVISTSTPILSQFLLSPLSTSDASSPISMSSDAPVSPAAILSPFPVSPAAILSPFPVSPAAILSPSPVTPTPLCSAEPASICKTQVSKKRTSRQKMPPSKKKERKKEQNKTAALRYRQKKKQESHTFEDKQEQLEQTNMLLKQELSGLENEMRYLKQLWMDVCQTQQRL